MKIITSFIASLTMLCLFAFTSYGNTNGVDHHAEVTSKIENYLSSIDYKSESGSATIFANFIVKEEGDLYNVNFLITENNEILILSKDYEEEFYKVDSYNPNYIKVYQVLIPEIAV